MKYLVAILKTSVAQTAGMRKKPISSLSSSISGHADISAQSCTKEVTKKKEKNKQLKVAGSSMHRFGTNVSLF